MFIKNNLPREASVRIIDALSIKEIARVCRVTEGAVCAWKRNGMPRYRLDQLLLAFPNHKAIVNDRTLHQA